jgi:hypothetical protein
LGKDYLGEAFESRKVLNPYKEDKADLDKMVQRNYLLEVYGVEPTNRAIDLGPKPPSPIKDQALGMKTLKRKTLKDIDTGHR